MYIFYPFDFGGWPILLWAIRALRDSACPDASGVDAAEEGWSECWRKPNIVWRSHPFFGGRALAVRFYYPLAPRTSIDRR
ncbi:hypothetical protein CEXT_475721 [Caerostris extrusa]|uniref:Secreted protein n=1 Tax=Caerostris extrusa TaxID=172846 RepID=A0AAV4NC53_CAEEX|nr:hypothetical protein CEXT_475721 [Caerostris extrusa]